VRDGRGEVAREGRVATTAPALEALGRELGAESEVRGRPGGGHDDLPRARRGAGGPGDDPLLQRAAAVADRRLAEDVPTGAIRELRAVLSRRRVLHADYNR